MELVTVLTAFVMKNIPNPWVPPKRNLESNFHPFGFLENTPLSKIQRGVYCFFAGFGDSFPATFSPRILL
jgi:hypothetical protein